MSQLHESGFYAGAQRVAALLLANLITVFLLLTIVGAPFGLLGLFAVANEWINRRELDFFQIYLGSIRQRWRAALGLGALTLAGAGLVAVNLTLLPAMGSADLLSALSLMFTLGFAIVLLMTNIYAWSILTQLNLSLRATLRLSLLLALSYPLKSLAITVVALVPLLGSLFLPAAFYLFVSLCAAALIAARGVSWVLNQRFSSEELEQLKTPANRNTST